MTKSTLGKHKRRRNPVRLERRQQTRRAADFRALVNDAVQGVIVHRNFKPLYVNQAFAALFGYENTDAIMELPLLRSLVPDDVWPRLESEYDELMRGAKNSVIGRSRGLHKNGHEIWIAVTLRVIDWRGDHAMMLTAFDITTQVEQEHVLLQNEQKLRAVLEILPYPIYVARKSDGQILFANRKTCLLFQQSAAQFLRMKSGDLFVDPADRQNLDNLFASISDIRDIEAQMKSVQGRVFTAEIAAIVLDYNGDPSVLVALNDISQRKEMEAELFRQASTDSLTGINNLRTLRAIAEQEVRRSRRFARDMSMMMIDIDNFKPINDTYGHATGDDVIKAVVKRATDLLRQTDQIGRIGGEEFAVLLPETSLAAAYEVAERLRRHIEEKPVTAGTIAVDCTVSIGVAQLSEQDSGIDDVLKRADRALYVAKNGGRNRVEKAD